MFLHIVQTAIDTNIAKLNTLLKAGVVIPEIAGITVSNVEVNFYKEYLEAGISLSPAFWEQFSNAMYTWKMYRLGNVLHQHKHHKNHKRSFIARKFHQMKKFMKKSYKYIEEETIGQFIQNWIP